MQDKTKEAYNIGVRMCRTDEWLKASLKGAEHAAHNGGKEGLLLVVRELAKDDHFKMNWWPIILRAAGDEASANEALWSVWQGYADTLMGTFFHKDPVLESIEEITQRKRR